jgi:predicted nucleic acid-binding protein
MILVDTTIWIEFFRSNPVYFNGMESLLENKEVIIIEPIFAELLYGSRSHKERSIILSYWKVLPHIKFIEGTLIESADFGNKENYINMGIGLIDTILVKVTIENKYLIWTLDKKILNNLDKKFLYKP